MVENCFAENVRINSGFQQPISSYLECDHDPYLEDSSDSALFYLFSITGAFGPTMEHSSSLTLFFSFFSISAYCPSMADTSSSAPYPSLFAITTFAPASSRLANSFPWLPVPRFPTSQLPASRVPTSHLSVPKVSNSLLPASTNWERFCSCPACPPCHRVCSY